jgi:uncharacterized protein DUF1592/uncharacterized protein DUF1588/uncharacterized protein DUF1587/uncharacterized protein DUF1585/uncharacterized protein DUF1595
MRCRFAIDATDIHCTRESTRDMPYLLLTVMLTVQLAALVDASQRVDRSAVPVSPGPATGSPSTFINSYCAACHNSRIRAGGLVLTEMDPTVPADATETWERVLQKLRAGAMPPAGAPRPPASAMQSFIEGLEQRIDAAAAAHPDPGWPGPRRLSRFEYGNVIRDLLALEIDVAEMLPPDDTSFGFDNVASGLSMSPSLVERYVAAAERISALAIGDPSTPPIETSYHVRYDLTQNSHIEGLPLGTRGGILIRATFPLTGDYVIAPTLWRTNVGFIRGLRHPHSVDITLDGARVHLATIGTSDDYLPSLMRPEQTAKTLHSRLQARVRLTAGPHTIGVTFVDKSGALNPALLQPFAAVFDPVDSDGVPQLEAVAISGPFHGVVADDTPSRRRIYVCRPSHRVDERPCARTILRTLAQRAFGRSASDHEIALLMEQYELGRQNSFDSGIQRALQRLLIDPAFLFRVGLQPRSAAAGRVTRVPPDTLATRLAFFLWSRIPDEQLMAAAARGRLSKPRELAAEVARMLADPRARALVTNFAGHWLQLRNLANVRPTKNEFPDFDDNLRQAFRRETELLIESMIVEDRSISVLLDADYTYVNERLARHYGIAGIRGSRYRRVRAPADRAGLGLIGQGSILAVTSHANRTSPVLRGKWILENVLGAAPPPPPPEVPTLEQSAGENPPATIRAQLELHRAAPSCATCHRLMDPLGLALENFDALGLWRASESGAAIDATAVLPDGTSVNGPKALAAWLRQHLDVFARTMTEKLLIYALGRGLTYRDMPAVRAIVNDAARENYRFSALVTAIAASVPFQMQLASDE